MSRAEGRRWGIAGLLLLYCGLLAVALLAPTSSTAAGMANWMVGGWVTQARAEFIGNVLIIVPISALGSAAWPRTTWRDWTTWCFLTALAVETIQGALLPHRTPAAIDVVANTLGGVAGSLLVLGVRRLRQPHDRVVRSDPSGP